LKHTLTVNRQVNVTKIALTGALRSGKDVTADILRAHYGFSRFAFGDALKRTAHEVFSWIDRESKPRALYQNYGQLMREIDPDVWVRHTERAIENHIDIMAGLHGETAIGIVVTDLRQPNEEKWCRENGFTIIRVKAQSALRIARAQQAGDAFSLEDLTHSTEAHTDGFSVDYELVNDGSIDELKRQIDVIMAQINAV
jgi:dephospho-CoA kinase